MLLLSYDLFQGCHHIQLNCTQRKGIQHINMAQMNVSYAGKCFMTLL
jgi:hypothetical protein